MNEDYQKWKNLFIRIRDDPEKSEFIALLQDILKKAYKKEEIGFQIHATIGEHLVFLMKQKKKEQIQDLADAVHVLPELFFNVCFSPYDYWKTYYLPYQKQYQDPILDFYKDWFIRDYFFVRFGEQPCFVTKITEQEFSKEHKACIAELEMSEKKLFFPDKRWKSTYLGAGEEKAVYAIRDPNGRIFALELIDERHYLNGRLMDGPYYYTTTASDLMGKKLNDASLVGLQFTGMVKAREYIYGYEWGRFCYSALKSSRWKDSFFTMYLQGKFLEEFRFLSEHYKDVHDRNVMFEIVPRKEGKCTITILDERGEKKKVGIRLRGIDLR